MSKKLVRISIPKLHRTKSLKLSVQSEQSETDLKVIQDSQILGVLFLGCSDQIAPRKLR